MTEHQDTVETFITQLNLVNTFITERSLSLSSLPTNSTPTLISNALAILPTSLPEKGLGIEKTTSILLNDLSPALSPGHAGPRYFGLVTGGVTPIAQIADMLVTSFDNSLQLHLPEESISTLIEEQSLTMLLSLLSLPSSIFTSNTFTTGATTSNLLALSIARESVIGTIKRQQGIENWSVAEMGNGGIELDIFCARSHTSVAKCAAILGMGRANVYEVLLEEDENVDEMCAFDLIGLEKLLKRNKEIGRGSVVVSSFGEVNTGGFTPHSKKLRKLCDDYNAWFHIDAAFGAFACLHPDFSYISAEMALADSITSDAHKWLNVPYDCGIFFSRSNFLTEVCGPGSTIAPYLLSSPPPPSTTSPTSFTSTSISNINLNIKNNPSSILNKKIPHPLFKNLENSRRFRALPIYTSLLSYGRSGLTEIIVRNIEFCRMIEIWMREGGGSGGYKVLTPFSCNSSMVGGAEGGKGGGYKTLNVLLFTSSDLAPIKYKGLNGINLLKEEINKSLDIFVTGTNWGGSNAIRMAVSNWGTELIRDGEIVKRVLEEVMRV